MGCSLIFSRNPEKTLVEAAKSLFSSSRSAAFPEVTSAMEAANAALKFGVDGMANVRSPTPPKVVSAPPGCKEETFVARVRRRCGGVPKTERFGTFYNLKEFKTKERKTS